MANIKKTAIKGVLLGRKQGHGGTVHPNKAYTGGGKSDYRQQGHPYSGLGLKQLKHRESRAFGDLQQLREQGNMRGVRHAKTQVNKLRHRLTTKILGGQAGQGFNPGLSVKGQHKATRQLLRAKLGSNFGKFYYTGGGQGEGQQRIGNIKTPPGPGNPNIHPVGPPNRRKRTGYSGY